MVVTVEWLGHLDLSALAAQELSHARFICCVFHLIYDHNPSYMFCRKQKLTDVRPGLLTFEAPRLSLSSPVL